MSDVSPSSFPAEPQRAVRVRRWRSADATVSARIHHQALPEGFFAQLGPAFLARYHESFSGPFGVALVAEIEGEVVAVLLGTVDDGAHYPEVMRRCGAPLARAAVIGLVRHPGLGPHFVRTRLRRYLRGMRRLVRRRSSIAAIDAPIPLLITGSLTHVAVRSEVQGVGVGSALVAAYSTAVAEQGVTDRLEVLTRSDQSGAARFYERRGWQRDGAVTDLDGNLLDRLTRDVGSQPS